MGIYFNPDQIDPEPTPGKHSRLLYRRVKLNTRYPGIVRYPAELETLVPDVRVYIAEWLEHEVNQYGYKGLAGRLYSPVDVPLPGDH